MKGESNVYWRNSIESDMFAGRISKQCTLVQGPLIAIPCLPEWQFFGRWCSKEITTTLESAGWASGLSTAWGHMVSRFI